MKFTTPDIASEPYTADAPPVMVCTLDENRIGNEIDVDVAEDVRERQSPAIEQHQIAIRAERMQVHGGVAARALSAVARGARRCELRQLIERRFERDGAALLQVLDRRDHDGAGRDAIRIG